MVINKYAVLIHSKSLFSINKNGDITKRDNKLKMKNLRNFSKKR